MKLAIAHYHFRRGGVTQVVLNHLRGLAETGAAIETVYLLYGDSADGIADSVHCLPFPVKLVQVDGLGYSSNPEERSQELATRLASSLSENGASPGDTVIHIHNHSLGKNAAVPGAMAKLASAGWPILTQIHDFAEDYRPENYRLLIEASSAGDPAELESSLYPQAANIHYATLTRRDHELLATVGVAPERLHCLPNSVADSDQEIDRDAARSRVTRAWGVDPDRIIGLYPVRGIRRKNIGEMLLWSAVAENLTMGITLQPKTPVEQTGYLMWRRFAEAQRLPVQFDAGQIDGITFADNQAACDFCFTSSVAEGFGMVFLETWLAGRPLLGRDLPGVTADFRAASVQFPGLADSLAIPTDIVGAGVEAQIWEAFGSAWHSLPDAFIDALDLAQPNPIASGTHVDFARLPVGTQAQVIAQVVKDPGLAQAIRTANPVFSELTKLNDPSTAEIITGNAQIVRDGYSVETLGGELLSVYQRVLASDRSSEVMPPSGAGQLFRKLANYESFCPCRTLEL